MAFNSASHRYLLPSVVTPRFRGKTSSMASEAWRDDLVQPDVPPPLKGSVHLLGRKYTLPLENGIFMEDSRSRLWFTYRKNFRPIGDTSYTSDSGWGCTLRCGQMMLGHALILRHLGRDWQWSPNKPSSNNETYQKILRMFLDSRDSEYSIQMIALQGADFGRSVGQWFGPNNVAQAIKRLVVHDEWSKMVVYIAMDMLVIIDDIKKLAKEPHGVQGTVEVTTFEGDEVLTPSNNSGYTRHFSFSDPSLNETPTQSETAGNNPPTKSTPIPKTSQSKMFNFSAPKVSRSYDPTIDTSLINLTMEDLKRGAMNSTLQEELEIDGQATSEVFRPVLLIIPLRLGQEKFNMEYCEAIKACLALKQTVGIIGGKPRHALWFTGYHENFLLYLDPHRTQQSVSLTEEMIPDQSYHSTQMDRIHISELDPSLALGFFCKSEADLDELCHNLKSKVLSKMKYLFELTQHRPAYWGPPESVKHSSKEPFVLLQAENHSVESDDGFELVDWPYQISEPESTLSR